MRSAIHNLYSLLKDNTENYITFFEKNEKRNKAFSEFIEDVEKCIGKLESVRKDKNIVNIGILGPTSYQWMVLDHACLKGGYKSIAIPETYSLEQVGQILEDTKTDLLLIDEKLKDKYSFENFDLYFFNCSENNPHDFHLLPVTEIADPEANKLLEEYSITFSSGTSERFKKIPLKLHKIVNEDTNRNLWNRISSIVGFIMYRKHFWGRSDNKVIIYLPFSHSMQRGFVLEALFHRMNIVISDPVNCLKHIITEKPNVMVSVPFVYEAMASRIRGKLNNFNSGERFLFKLYNRLGINSLGNKNFIKRYFSQTLFKDIRKIYGGKADLFITGSAPISPEVLKVFYSVGVKVFEAYGQSEMSAVIMNTSRHFKIGSVGKPSLDLKIANDSEILLKYNDLYDNHNKDILKVDENGYIHTGDLGYIDKDGFLFITGRKDDVIVLEQGKKVFPSSIEKKFNKFDFINQVMVLSVDKTNISAVITCNDGFQTQEAAFEAVKAAVEEINKSLAGYEAIKSFYIASDAFTVENGMLTPTFKLKRKTIFQNYSHREFKRV
jgi:long-chain acyl-CoA synthetase